MLSTTRQHPALASVAARAASAGSPTVLFNVTHFGAGPEATPLAPPTDIAPPSEHDHVATETLAFHPADAGFQVHTWAPQTPSKPVEGVSISRIAVSPQVDERGLSYHLYRGSMVINPNFLYDPAHSSEILVTLGHDPWRPDFADSLMIARVYHGMTSAAVAGSADDEGVPVLFLQSPVAPFRDPSPKFRGDGSGELPRVASGMALRMLVGLDSSDPRKRIALLSRIADLAHEYGLGLQAADRRFGRVRGEWWSVISPDFDKYKRRKEELFDWAPPGVPEAVQLVTFVGPARVGSSAAITADFVARNMGILAVSEASLQEMAFLNVMVPIAPARMKDTPTAGTCLPIEAGLGQLARDCGLTRRQEASKPVPIGRTAATDYQVLSTGPVAPRIAGADEYPVWLSWAIPLEPDAAARPPDVAQLALAQLCAADDRVTGGRIDYYRVRVTPDGRVKGRAKIVVSLVPSIARTSIPGKLSELCGWAQREVMATLVRDHVPQRSILLRLAWRERWLGRVGTVM